MLEARRSWWISVVFFLLAAAPGCWLPVISNILAEKGWEHLILWVFIMPPLAVIIAPLFFATLADERFPAQKVLGAVMISGAATLGVAFWMFETRESPAGFLLFFALASLIGSPAWSLLMAITFSTLGESGKFRFGSFRVWGTLGWVAAGLTVSYLDLDLSPRAGYLAVGIRLVAGVACFFLPHTPPVPRASRKWHEMMGFGAFRLLKDRNLAVYFGTTFLLTIPLVAYYSHTPRHLEALGFENVAAAMTIGQASEIMAMLAMGAVMRRWRLKAMFLLGIFCGVLRFGLNIGGGVTDMVWWILAGIALHGICWTFFFETGRLLVDRGVPKGQKSQTQALLTFAQGGLGGVVGILFVAPLYDRLVVQGGDGGWTTFWSILTAMCAVCLVIFAVGYRGITPRDQQDPGSAN